MTTVLKTLAAFDNESPAARSDSHGDTKVAALASGEKTSVTKSDNLMRQQDQKRTSQARAHQKALAVELARLGWRCPSGHACRIIFWLSSCDTRQLCRAQNLGPQRSSGTMSSHINGSDSTLTDLKSLGCIGNDRLHLLAPLPSHGHVSCNSGVKRVL